MPDCVLIAREREFKIQAEELYRQPQSHLLSSDLRPESNDLLTFLRSGDLGCIGAHGVQLMGRIDEQVNIAGTIVHVEHILYFLWSV